MTGEFFELLSKHSILSSSLSPHAKSNAQFFQKGITDGVSMNLLNRAFQVRVNQVAKKSTAEENFDYLSGLLIGYELKEIDLQVVESITVISSPDLNDKYLKGLTILGFANKSKAIDAGQAMVNGHCKIYAAVKDQYGHR